MHYDAEGRLWLDKEGTPKEGTSKFLPFWPDQQVEWRTNWEITIPANTNQFTITYPFALQNVLQNFTGQWPETIWHDVNSNSYKIWENCQWRELTPDECKQRGYS